MVEKIIEQEQSVIEDIINTYYGGNTDEANTKLYQLFIKHGYKTDCDDTNQIIEYINRQLEYRYKNEQYTPINDWATYEINKNGVVRNIKTKHILPVITDSKGNKKVKLCRKKEIKTLSIDELLYNTFHDSSTDNNNQNEEIIDFSSDI